MIGGIRETTCYDLHGPILTFYVKHRESYTNDLKGENSINVVSFH